MVKAELDGQWFRVSGGRVLVKGAGGGRRPSGPRIVEGVASTPARDLHGEIVEPRGFDLSYFERHGRINWDHGKGPGNIIGEPVDWTLTPKQFYLWARLYDGPKLANESHELLAAGGDEPDEATELAWSVEGKVTERDPKDRTHVLGALVINVALTPNPVNPETWARLSDRMAKSVDPAGKQALHRSLDSSSGAALVPQSLEDDPHDLLTKHLAKAMGCGCLEGSGDGMRFARGYEGAVAHFRLCCGATPDMAITVARQHDQVARTTGRRLTGG